MCLGAAMWSGVRRLVCGATRQDAEALGFDEGPVSEASYQHLQRRGVEVVRGVLRDEAQAVLQRYRDLGRPIY
jgi:tRNA(Arg) A34 adenosine deaminase TadA